jgi:hypothetical protein
MEGRDMGLDAWAFATRSDLIGDAVVDFDVPEAATTTLTRWRSHYLLHEWMDRLYRARGGRDAAFSCVNVRVEAADLDALEECAADIWATGGDETWPDYEPAHRRADAEFLAAARRAIAEGLAVVYRPWT